MTVTSDSGGLVLRPRVTYYVPPPILENTSRIPTSGEFGLTTHAYYSVSLSTCLCGCQVQIRQAQYGLSTDRHAIQ